MTDPASTTPTVRRSLPEPEPELEPFDDFARSMDQKVRGLKSDPYAGKGYSINPNALKNKLAAMRARKG